MLEDIPHSLGYEKSILSTLLKEPETYQPRARLAGLTAEHFHIPAHRTLFSMLMSTPPEACELIAFTDELKRAGHIDAIGGLGALTDIYTYAPNSAHWHPHIKGLREYLARRIALNAARAISEDPTTLEVEDIRRMLTETSDKVADAVDAKSRLWTAPAAVKALLERMREGENGRTPGMPTGLEPIDLATGGMARGSLWVAAAETSCGKSVLLLQIAMQALRAGKRVLVVSLELSKEDVMARLVTVHSRVPINVYLDPRKANALELKQAKRALEDANGWNLVIDDEGGRTIADIEGIVDIAADALGGIDLVVIDYIQRISAARHKNDTREQEVAAISSGMKRMAMRHQIPVVTASQLNESQKVRESRAIAHDCDVLLTITEDGIKGDKIRNGERDQLFPLFLNGKLQRFERKE